VGGKCVAINLLLTTHSNFLLCILSIKHSLDKAVVRAHVVMDRPHYYYNSSGLSQES